MIVLLVLALAVDPSWTLVAQSLTAQGPRSRPGSTFKLTNQDLLTMQAAGLGVETIVEKIRTSHCEFDTSPLVLAQLKAAGVAETVILEMIRSDRSSSHQMTESPEMSSPRAKEVSRPSESPGISPGYAISYVKSEREWKYSIQHESYDQVSKDFEAQLRRAFDSAGLHPPSMIGSDACCRLTLEVLEVTTHPAVIKKIGIDVSANVTVTDGTGRFLYGKGYRGEFRTFGGLAHWKQWISEAVGDMVDKVVADDNVLRVLTDGKL
jgi:hypothetical protein